MLGRFSAWLHISTPPVHQGTNVPDSCNMPTGTHAEEEALLTDAAALSSEAAEVRRLRNLLAENRAAYASALTEETTPSATPSAPGAASAGMPAVTSPVSPPQACRGLESSRAFSVNL